VKRLAITVGLFLVMLVTGVILTRPPRFQVQRSVVVAAPPAVAFEKLNALHQWPTWSKWGKDRVPTSDALAGPPAGIGSNWTWQPTRGGSHGLEIVPEGNGTRVTATFAGELELLGKLVSIVKPPEAVIGPSLDRELGLFAAMVASP
jgi:hypothetical protein